MSPWSAWNLWRISYFSTSPIGTSGDGGPFATPLGQQALPMKCDAYVLTGENDAPGQLWRMEFVFPLQNMEPLMDLSNLSGCAPSQVCHLTIRSSDPACTCT
jgi:hypothetical protein